MDWQTIMEMKNPRKALIAINEKVEKEMLPLEEMAKAVEKYAEKHGITVEEMAYYPNGENVLQPMEK